jgi:uncharacterized protein (DUF302 family)
MIVKHSASGYPDTVQALTDALDRRGLTLFARIDHAAAARDVGMELADEEVLVFGNPRGGTPLMQADPRVGIDLPLRMLLWQDGDATAVGYRDPHELAGAYRLDGLDETLAQLAALLEALSEEACAPAGAGGRARPRPRDSRATSSWWR